MPWDWIREHRALVVWLTAGSVVLFVGTLIAIPIMIVKMRNDYFVRPKEDRAVRAHRHPLMFALYLAAKNLLGAVFMLMGLAMLLTPGQGVLTILVGLTLMNFPGKRRLETWVVTRRPVRRAMDWLRHRAGVPPLRLPHP